METWIDERVREMKDRLSDKDVVVVDGRIVALRGYTPVGLGQRVSSFEDVARREPLAMWRESV